MLPYWPLVQHAALQSCHAAFPNHAATKVSEPGKAKAFDF
jgi:hypothetical protein